MRAIGKFSWAAAAVGWIAIPALAGDLQLSKITLIRSPGRIEYVRTADNLAVWVEGRYESIKAYDFDTGQLYTLPTSSNVYHPDVSGRTVVWASNKSIFCLRIHSGFFSQTMPGRAKPS